MTQEASNALDVILVLPNGSSSERVEEVRRGLMLDLRDAGIEAHSSRDPQVAAEGSKVVGEVLSIGGITMAIPWKTVVEVALPMIESLIKRLKGGKVVVVYGKDRIELDNASPDDRERLVQSFIRRHERT